MRNRRKESRQEKKGRTGREKGKIKEAEKEGRIGREEKKTDD